MKAARRRTSVAGRGVAVLGRRGPFSLPTHMSEERRPPSRPNRLLAPGETPARDMPDLAIVPLLAGAETGGGWGNVWPSLAAPSPERRPRFSSTSGWQRDRGCAPRRSGSTTKMSTPSSSSCGTCATRPATARRCRGRAARARGRVHEDGDESARRTPAGPRGDSAAAEGAAPDPSRRSYLTFA